MKRGDTTVILDGALVEEVSKELEPGQTLTGFVREAVDYRLRRARMRKAAVAYEHALRKNPALAEEMAAWEQADLASPPRKSRRKGKA
jgi:hypothetical protein